MSDIEVLYEDNHIIAVNKRPSDIVQGDRTGDITLADHLRAYLREKYHKSGNVFVGIPHRLDRPTSGVVIFARTDKALERLSALFREGGVKKTYWAMVGERPAADSGELTHWLVRDPVANKSRAVRRPVTDAARPADTARAAREARLSYRVLFSLERYTLLEIELLTGRHHQIRAQLAAVGCHIKGDLKYGSPRSNPGGGIHLHARQASFIHPVSGKQVTVVARPPADPLWDAAVARWEKEASR
jgi:23S rRNA pseudouridine1911/1915/1917 synthase